MAHKDIRFLESRLLKGPNLWTYKPVLEVVVDIGDLEDCPSNTIPGYPARLVELLPSLDAHRCSYGEPGGFIRRLEEGTWPGHILEHVTLELQNLAGLPGGFGRARETSTRGVYKVVVAAWQETITRTALAEARELVLAAMAAQPFDVAASVARLRDLVSKHWLGPSTACIVQAAEERRIPYIRLLDSGNLVQLGYGAAMRRIWTAETDQTSAIAEGISRDKDLTKRLLESCGVPVPEGREAATADEAWEIACDIGLPVCVKPSDGNHGRGVFTELSDETEIRAAWAIALNEGSSVLVERNIPGIEHRLLIIGGKLVAAIRGGMMKGSPKSPVEGRQISIQRQGTHAVDVTDQVHPDTIAIASLAARIVGLDIAGIDLVCGDISRPLHEQGGAVVEVNAGPGLLPNLAPGEVNPRPVGAAIVEHIFPDASASRIPVIGISGSEGRADIALMLRHILQLSGHTTGVACEQGMYLGKRKVDDRPSGHWTPARRLLMAREVDAAIIENAAPVILEEGLAYDRCQVGIVTGMPGTEGLERWDILTPEQVFTVIRTQVDVVLPGGVAVLNAEDAVVADMARLCDGEAMFFGNDPEQDVLLEQRRRKGRSVFVRHGAIILARGASERPVARLDDLHRLAPPSEPIRLRSLLATIAACWALGIAPEIIRSGLATCPAPDSNRTNS